MYMPMEDSILIGASSISGKFITGWDLRSDMFVCPLTFVFFVADYGMQDAARCAMQDVACNKGTIIAAGLQGV